MIFFIILSKKLTDVEKRKLKPHMNTKLRDPKSIMIFTKKRFNTTPRDISDGSDINNTKNLSESLLRNLAM